MHLKHIRLENAGPIEHLEFDMPFDGDRPKPVVFVGENGTGKSLVLAHIANAIIAMKQMAYENAEVERGKVYKFRSPQYVRRGAKFTYSKLLFSNGLTVGEWQLLQTKKSHEETNGSPPNIKDWERIENDKASSFWIEGQSTQKVEKAFGENCYLFFPPNRFEEPGWLNIFNLQDEPRFVDARRTTGRTERSILVYSVLPKIKNWLLELAFDREVLERQLAPNPLGGDQPLYYIGHAGRATGFLDAVDKILNLIFRSSNGVRIAVSAGAGRQIAVVEKQTGQAVIANIASLSTGESLLLFLCLAILMDFEMSGRPFRAMSDVHGIVVVDEIDLHLHAKHLRHTLPKLLRMFPNVQFIITTHSPLFLLGMQHEYGVDGFHMIEMPSGERITAERFQEFEAAFNYFKDTQSFAREIETSLKKNAAMPVLFVEGESDIVLLRTAWQKRRGGDMTFVLANGHGRAHIAVMFKDEDSLNKSKNRVVMGLWDFDEAFNDWNGVKFTTVTEQEHVGLVKKHPQLNRYAVLLPVPANRAILASKSYGMKSRMPIELLFSDAVLARHNNRAITESRGWIAAE